jgi:hypothetical protein
MAKQNGHDGPVVTPEAIDRLEAYARAQLPIEALGERAAWRDRSIVALRGLREANPSLPA